MTSLIAARAYPRTATSNRPQRHTPGRATTPCRTRVAWIESLALAVVLLLLLVGVLGASSRAQTPLSNSRMRVEPGETLWAVARAHPMPGQTTEQTAEQIAELNSLHDERLVPGMTLRVPAQPPDGTTLAVAMR
jgi:hypothetical protein